MYMCIKNGHIWPLRTHRGTCHYSSSFSYNFFICSNFDLIFFTQSTYISLETGYVKKKNLPSHLIFALVWLRLGSGSSELYVYVLLLIWKLSLSRTRHSYAPIFGKEPEPHLLSQLQQTGSSYPAPAPWLQLYNTVNVITFAPIWIHFSQSYMALILRMDFGKKTYCTAPGKDFDKPQMAPAPHLYPTIL
jgi:hypothetical protein